MADVAQLVSQDPTFDLPTGGASDFYLSREVNNRDDSNHGKVIKKHGLWKYPYLTRRTGDSLVGTNEEITSSELRHGRAAGKTKLGNASSSGSHDFEYSPETFDDQMEGAFRSKWFRLFNDGQAEGIAKDYHTKKGYIHVNGDDGCYNQVANGKRVTEVPLFYTEDEAGTADDPYGLIKISAKNMGAVTRKLAADPFGKFICHELHVGNTPVKYSFVSRIPINDTTVRYQNYKHVEVGEMNLNVTVNSIVTGSFNLMGSNNPSYYTENAEKGKTRMAEKMGSEKDVAVENGSTELKTEQTYSADFKDAAEKFISAVKNTTVSTSTDQFTAMEGFLFVNGHQLQFASDLTMDINNNLSPINAIFVKGAIANTSPRLEVTGNITTYFTDGEADSNGVKFGADDLKNLASENKDVEVLYAFQDKEDPEELYLFQIFKSTFSAPSESKDADNPITLDMNYSSYGEMAVRCLRLAVPKIRSIEFDVDEAVSKLAEGTKEVKVVLYPNVPLDVTNEASYVDVDSENYVFQNVEVSVNSEEDEGSSFTNVKIEEDGSISAVLNLTENLVKGDLVQLKVVVNDTECEKTAEIVPSIYYVRMGKTYAENAYTKGYLPVVKEQEISVLTADDGASELTDEDYLFFIYNRAEGYDFSADDFDIRSSNEAVANIVDGTVVIEDVTEGEATITVTNKYDTTVSYSFVVKAEAGLVDDDDDESLGG